MKTLVEYISESQLMKLDYDMTYIDFLNFLTLNDYIESNIDANEPHADFKIDEMQYCFGSSEKYYHTILFKDARGNRCKMGFDLKRPNKLDILTVTIMDHTVNTDKFSDAVQAVCTYMFPGKLTPGKNI